MTTQEYEFPLLTESEYAAMRLLKESQSIMLYNIETKTYVNCIDIVVPGMAIFKKLIKKGLCYITVEDPMEDGTEFSSSIDLTDKGVAMLPVLEKYIK